MIYLIGLVLFYGTGIRVAGLDIPGMIKLALVFAVLWALR